MPIKLSYTKIQQIMKHTKTKDFYFWLSMVFNLFQVE